MLLLRKGCEMPELHRITLDDPFATFDEWGGDADRKAYADP
jgi:hypothetical protein